MNGSAKRSLGSHSPRTVVQGTPSCLRCSASIHTSTSSQARHASTRPVCSSTRVAALVVLPSRSQSRSTMRMNRSSMGLSRTMPATMSRSRAWRAVREAAGGDAGAVLLDEHQHHVAELGQHEVDVGRLRSAQLGHPVEEILLAALLLAQLIDRGGDVLPLRAELDAGLGHVGIGSRRRRCSCRRRWHRPAASDAIAPAPRGGSS